MLFACLSYLRNSSVIQNYKDKHWQLLASESLFILNESLFKSPLFVFAAANSCLINVFLDHLKLGSTWLHCPEQHFHKKDQTVLLQIGMKCLLKAYVPFSSLKRNRSVLYKMKQNRLLLS